MLLEAMVDFLNVAPPHAPFAHRNLQAKRLHVRHNRLESLRHVALGNKTRTDDAELHELALLDVIRLYREELL